jgi:hypothetical protein
MTPSDTNNGDRPIVLVHSSDLHVDDIRTWRQYDGVAGLAAVLDAAAAVAADIVLLVGDTFDNLRVSTPALHRVAALLAAAPMPVVLLPGNHDPALPECIFRRAGLLALPHVHVLGISHPETVHFASHSLEISGRAHRSFADMPPVPPPAPRSTRWRIIMAHGHYVPPDEWASQAHRAWLISDADLAATDADYVALGHWDRAAAVGDGSVPAYYSGSPDLAGTVNVIRLAESTGASIERLAVSCG